MTTTHTIDVEAEVTIDTPDFRRLMEQYVTGSATFGESNKLRAAIIAHIDARLAAKRSIQPTIAAEDVRDTERLDFLFSALPLNYFCVALEIEPPKDTSPVSQGKWARSAIDAAIATPTPPSKG